MFHAPDEFPFVPVLEDAWQIVLEEYRAVRPRMEDWVERKLYDEGWKVIGLYDFPHGAPIPEHIALCPRTAALVHEHVPTHGVVGFSVLAPGTRIVPHEGYQGDFLRCHLALEVPEGDCGLEVEGDVRRWTAGRALVFDDRVTHRAWNLTDEERAVLIVDFVPE